MKVSISTALQILRKDEPDFAWDDAWETLKTLDTENAEDLPLLGEALSDEKPNVRLYALKAIGRIDGDVSSLVPEIAALVQDKKHWVRYEAVKLLGSIGYQNEPESVQALYVAMKNPREYLNVRLGSMCSLLRLWRRRKMIAAKDEPKS